jgi:PAS domain S-box-containing protein
MPKRKKQKFTSAGKRLSPPAAPGSPGGNESDNFRVHFENARDILFTLDRGLRFRAVSPSVNRVLGYSPEAMIRDGRILYRAIPARQAAGLRRLFRSAAAGIETGPVVCEARTRDGGIRILEFTASRCREKEAGQLLAVSARDITEWQRLADAVRQSEGKYRALVEATDTGYVILDAQGMVLDANREYLRLTGRRTLAAITGRHVAEWTAPHDQERNRAEVRKCLRRGSVRMFEVDYAHPDGTLVSVEINATVVDGEAGPQIVSVVRDITRRREMEAAIRENERQLRTLVQNQGEGVGIVDLSERFVFANPAAEQIFGVGPGGLTGKNLRDFTTPEQYHEAVRKTGLRRQDARATYELGIARPGGQARRILVTATPQRDRQDKLVGTFSIFRDITEWKRAEEALRASELRYRTLVETSPDAIIVSDMGGRVVAANQRAADMNRAADPSLLTGMGVYDFIVAEDRARAAENAKKALFGQPVHAAEYRMTRRDGSVFEAELSASVLPGADGRPAGFMAVVRDITERKRAEAALRESEERYRLLAENSNDVVFTADLNNRLTYVSPSIQRLQGFTVEEALDLGMEGLVAPGSLELLRAIHREGASVLEKGQTEGTLSSTVDLECRLKLGGTIWCEITAMVVKDGQGRPAGILGVIRGINERKQVEQALRESEEKYRTLFSQASDGIMLMPVEGGSFIVNESFARMHGYGSPEEMGHLRLEDLDTPQSARLIKKRLERMLAGEHLRFEVEHHHRDGRRFPLQVSCSVVRIGKRSYFLGFHQDITERKRLEKEVLEIGDRVQYQIGHDLHDGVNQMLTSASLRIGALAQKLKEGRLPDEDDLRAIARLNRETMDQVSALARGLSPLSIKQGGLAMGLSELCRTTSDLGVDCRAWLDESLEIGDLAAATHLYRIAQEAVNNALKHAAPKTIEVALGREGDRGLLSIADDGRGLPPGGTASQGMGLNIMRYRAGIIGAELEVVPGGKGGTVVRCLFSVPHKTKTNRRRR